MPKKNEKRSLAETHPEIAKEADGWDPKTESSWSKTPKSWRCSLGHKYQCRVYLRAQRDSGCKVCKKKRVEVGITDLMSRFPLVGVEAYEWDPKTVFPGSGTRKQWKCTQGHLFLASSYDRCFRNQNCPYCTDRKLLPGFNDLTSRFPTIAAEASGWDPSTVVWKSYKKQNWICSRGHNYEMQIRRRTIEFGNCPFCSSQRILAGFNDLVTKFPEIAKEAHGWDPKTIFAHSNRRMNWKCSKNHTYSSVVASRTLNGNKCPICANQQVLSGYNDLATTHPELLAEVDGWDASIVLPGSDQKRKWKCPEGHTFLMSPNHRTSRDSGCPTCASSGFDPSAKGWLYFIQHPEMELLQIGITNSPNQRLSRHRSRGWELIELFGPVDGLLVQEWETTILRHIKKQGGQFANKIGIEPFDGYSESWLKESFTLESFRQIMRRIEEIENNL